MLSSSDNRCGHYEEFDTYFKSESGHFPFERISTSADSGQLYKWIKCNNNYSQKCILKFFFERLHMVECPYASVAAAIINLYTAYLMRKAMKAKIQEFTDTLKKPLVNVCDGVDYDEHYRAIFTAILCNDLIFFQVLVRYGVLRPGKSEITRADLSFCLDLIMNNSSWFEKRQPPYDLHWGNIAKYTHTLFKFHYEMQTNPELRNKLLRSQIVIMLIHVMSYPEFSTDLADCLELYFEATAQSVVTVREIKEIIDIHPEPSYAFNEERLKECYNHLRSDFPDSDSLQPRTLQHLSRCALRDHLTERGVLPAVVKKLRIPNRIKQYILISNCVP